MTADAAPLFVPIGSNPARPFGIGACERALRLARNAGLMVTDTLEPGRPALLASLAFGWDEKWLEIMGRHPKSVLTYGGRPVIASLPKDEDPEPSRLAFESGKLPRGYEPIAAETAKLCYSDLRGSARPFVLSLDDQDSFEEGAFNQGYGRLADAFTLYLLRRPVFLSTRAAARAGITASPVTFLATISCLAPFLLFWRGDYGLGIMAAFLFILLDRLAADLERCTGKALRPVGIFRQGIDLVHPPFWWWAWLHGLGTFGRALEPIYSIMTLFVILGGYLGEALIAALSIKRFGGLEIHAWQPLDTSFLLIAASRNTNLLILAVAFLFGRPDTGLVAVAGWTLLSLIFHVVRLAQMTERSARGQTIASWLHA